MPANKHRYVATNTAPAGWTTPAFVDSGWALGWARFGYGTTGPGGYNTSLPAATTGILNFYFRTSFCISPARLAWFRALALTLNVLADNGAEVYINGVRVLNDVAANHDPKYWNNLVALSGSNTAFVSGVCRLLWFFGESPAKRCSRGCRSQQCADPDTHKTHPCGALHHTFTHLSPASLPPHPPTNPPTNLHNTHHTISTTHTGVNTIAVHVSNTAGSSDAGLDLDLVYTAVAPALEGPGPVTSATASAAANSITVSWCVA